MGHHSPERPAQHQVASRSRWTASTWEALFFPTEGGGYSGYGFVFPAHSASTHLTVHRLPEYLIYCHGISHRIASSQGTRSTANEVHQWARARARCWSYPAPHRFKVSIRQGDWPFGDWDLEADKPGADAASDTCSCAHWASQMCFCR